MRSVKDAGPGEVDALRRRIGRALGKRAISSDDHDFIRTRLDEIDSRIEQMEEEDDGTA
jgi:hypothetical protein